MDSLSSHHGSKTWLRGQDQVHIILDVVHLEGISLFSGIRQLASSRTPKCNVQIVLELLGSLSALEKADVGEK